MREVTKSEMRIYQDQNFKVLLSITGWGEGTNKRKNSTWGTSFWRRTCSIEQSSCRTALKAKVEEDFRFPKTLLILHPPYPNSWFLFHTLATKEGNCLSVFVYQHFNDYVNNLKIN